MIAFLVVTAGQWLNGGYYALAPLTWFLDRLGDIAAARASTSRRMC